MNAALCGILSEIAKLPVYWYPERNRVNCTHIWTHLEYRPLGNKTFFILNSAEHEIILLINLKMPTFIVDIA